jgi:cytoskeletal protein RodZ
MSISGCWLRRPIAICLAIVLAVPFADAAAMPQQPPQSQQAQDTSSAQAQPQNRSNDMSTPAASTTQPEASSVPQAPVPSQTTNSGQSASSPQTTPEQQQNTTQPIGTAAAPYERPTGAAVSRPAGAAIAPGKQKRRRTFLIKVGLVVGAAVAVGTVVALSKGSPSRPNQ